MPRRDEEKRIAFLRTLAVEDLANRRITEHSSELEKRMVHDARDAMKEKNDARYMTRHKKKAVVDVVKTQFNGIGRRAQAEVFGREGGLTGGMVGSWLIGGTLAAGTVAGIMSRGRLGKMKQGTNAIGRMTRQRIKFLNKTHLTDKDTDRLITVLKRAKAGKLSGDDRIWLKKKAVSYKNKSRNSLSFMQKHKKQSGNPNPSPKGEKPMPTDTPITQPTQKVGDPKRANPNMAARGETAAGRPQTAVDASGMLTLPQKETLAKLEEGKRLAPDEYAVLRQLNKAGKLTRDQQIAYAHRFRANHLEQKLKEQQAKLASATPSTLPSQATATPKPVAATAQYTDEALGFILKKGGTLPKNVPVNTDAVRQLRMVSKRPDLMLKKTEDHAEQVEHFARTIAEIAQNSPAQDRENICLLLSHKIAQANRPIENFGKSLYDRALALLNGGAEIKKKVAP